MAAFGAADFEVAAKDEAAKDVVVGAAVRKKSGLSTNSN